MGRDNRRRYRKIDVGIHNDAKFRNLGDKAKLLWFTLLTHPDLTPLGCMRMTEAGMAEEMDWPLKAFREAFGEALGEGMVRYCPKGKFLCFPNYLKYNKPESPNVVKSWEKLLGLLPECALATEYFQQVKAFLKGYGKAFLEAFPEGFLKASPNQEQEQDQEQDTPPLVPPTGGTPPPRFSVNDLGKLWNETAHPVFPRVTLPLSNSRRRKFTGALKDQPDPEWWRALIRKAGGIPFLTGVNDRGWKADLEFVLKKRYEILEGKYDNLSRQDKVPAWRKRLSNGSSGK